MHPSKIIQWSLSASMAGQGFVLRHFADHPVGRFLVRHVSHGGLGRILGAAAGLGRRLTGRGTVEVTLRALEVGFPREVTIEERSAARARISFARCPYGWRPGLDARLCDAAMELDRQLVAGLGGQLVIDDTIARGAPRCRFTLHEAPPEEEA